MLLAYVDPGLGALLWQTAVAGFVGFLFYLKKTRRWIVGRIRKRFGRGGKSETIATRAAAKFESKSEVR